MTRVPATLLDTSGWAADASVRDQGREFTPVRVPRTMRLMASSAGIAVYLTVAAAPPWVSFGF